MDIEDYSCIVNIGRLRQIRYLDSKMGTASTMGRKLSIRFPGGMRKKSCQFAANAIILLQRWWT
jgi:hypothetical protein